jgi:para-nitrobenzyl esterase
LPLWAAIQEPIKVEGGLVSGTPGWAWGVRAYLGIPFTAPPVKNLRWRPPRPVIPWQGVRAAKEFSPACIQPDVGWTDEQLADPGLWHRSEDCLYLNVWTPATSASDRLPVLVWIHAGTASTARPIYDGNALAKKGVVLVSLNYRIGILGWFVHPELSRESEHHSSGNYTALDQVAALQWVKNNIAQFGGDPNKVTMFGQSAGGNAVSWLTASPLVKGLVRGGIAQSCGGFMTRAMTLSEAETRGAQFAKAIGKPTLAALRAMPAQDLMEASLKTPGAPTSITVDGWFLPQSLNAIGSQGKQNDISLITGSTEDEAGNVRGGNGQPLPANTLAAYTAWVKETFGARAETILKLYPAKTDAEAVRAHHDIGRDVAFAPVRALAQAMAGKAQAYLYRWSHMPPHPAPNGINPVAQVGALHSSDIRFIFNTLRFKPGLCTVLTRRCPTEA